MPPLPPPLLAVFKSLTSVQLVPSQLSVLARLVDTCPPNAKAEGYTPAPAKPYLAVFKSFNSVQEDPFQYSFFAVALGANPPKDYTAVLVELFVPPAILVAVFMSVVSVHAEPFHNSTFVTLAFEVFSPPAIIPAVDEPSPT